MTRPSVLICAKAYPPDVGGVQTYTEYLARAYAKAGYSPVVVSQFEGAKGWNIRSYPEGDVSILNLGLGSQPVVFAKMLLEVLKLRASRRFAFAHATTWRPALAVYPWLAGLPLVLTVHGREVLAYPRALRGAMIAMLQRSALVVTVSHATMAVAKQALSGRQAKGQWRVAFNGLSYADLAAASHRAPRADGEPLRILSFCRLAERKNIHRCLAALALLREEGLDNFHYTIAGLGPMRRAIEQTIEQLGLGGHVTMAGYVEETAIPDMYRNADVFLHPQTAPEDGKDLEGFGLAIADAISFSAVAIVGEAGGPADFVKDGERGLVVDGEDVAAIAGALRTLMRRPKTLETLARQGRSWCLANLSWDRHAAEILDGLGLAGKMAGLPAPVVPAAR